MEKIKTIKIYNLVDCKGNKVQLELGITEVRREDKPWDSMDKGYRWRFIGKHIPMPVRSMYWFNGFPENIMLDWLKGNGWRVRTSVNTQTYHVNIWEVATEDVTSNESEIPEHVIANGRAAVDEAIRMLWDNGSRLKAVQLYRYAVNPCCSLGEATNAVREITNK